jgi:ABC-type glutathione transport system ATPase component
MLLDLRVSVEYGQKRVLDEAELRVAEGEILGLVGRSGEGKSTIALSILGLLALRGGRCTGEILFQGRDLLKHSHDMRKIRGKEIALVPQSPLASLNPNMRLGAQLQEAWRAHERGQPDWKPLLESVSLPPEWRSDS